MSKPVGLWLRLRGLLAPWRSRRLAGRGRHAASRGRRRPAADMQAVDGSTDHVPPGDVQPAGTSRQRRLLARRRTRLWEGRASFESLESRALLSASPGDNRFFGAIATPGQVDTHTVTVSSTTQLWFDGHSAGAGLSWSVTGPQGTLGGQPFSSGDAQLLQPVAAQPSARGLIPAGTHTVTVSGAGDATGGYSFRILDLSTATTITPGTVVSGTLPTPDGVSIYKLSADAGDNFS
ncbi:MAG: hypothetical protein ACKOTB_14805, partial [Planctomycetia bacterium]